MAERIGNILIDMVKRNIERCPADMTAHWQEVLKALQREEK